MPTASITGPGRRRAAQPKPDPTDAKALARAATRVRRLRYYPLRVRDGLIEVAIPGL